ncbi:MAG: glycerol kinase GlpK [Ferruginibacter sp.]
MNEKKYILAIDQGTSSTKTIIFDEQGLVIARASEPLKTNYLSDGFVEQDALGIFENVLSSVKKCIEQFINNGGDLTSMTCCGISNQRETFVVWNGKGKPLHNAVVWQCKRSVQVCERLKEEGLEDYIRSVTGLIIDPYFSASKLIWLKENNESIKKAISENDLYFGTIDTWLLYQLTDGKNYVSDYTNASRTMMFNLKTLQWDMKLIERIGLSGICLPQLKSSSADFGQTDFKGLLPSAININAMIGDSHAAAFGEGCFETGTAKATMGTGCSVLMNIGNEVKLSSNGMVTTICWSTEDAIAYALEGVIVSSGATVEWLKTELQLFSDNMICEAMAMSVNDNDGVYLVPAFSGLGSPHWNMTVKASINGLSFSSNKNHIARAALESIAYQIKDVIAAMEQDTNIELQMLMADGGITSNKFVMQFLTDLLQKNVISIGMPDVSALGAAYLAGLKSKVFKNIEQLKTLNKNRTILSPAMNTGIENYYRGWKKAVSKLVEQHNEN